jgi:hypothetical protein
MIVISEMSGTSFRVSCSCPPIWRSRTSSYPGPQSVRAITGTSSIDRAWTTGCDAPGGSRIALAASF